MVEPGSLYDYIPDQAPPPAGIWERIDNELTNLESLPALHALTSYTAIPPHNAWDNIVSQLEVEEATQAVERGMMSFVEGEPQVAPPPFVWQNIATILDKGSEQKEVPVKRTYRALWASVAAIAAVIVGVVLFAPSNQNDAAITKAGALATKLDNRYVPMEPTLDTEKSPSVASAAPAPFANQPGQKVRIPWLRTADTTNDLADDIDSFLSANSLASIDFKPMLSTGGELLTYQKKQRDLAGNIVDRVTDYRGYASDYAIAIGPHGENVRVSGKLTNMIEFFDDKDTTIEKTRNDLSRVEYLDTVLQLSGKWKYKYLSWKLALQQDIESDATDGIDPINLIKYLATKK